MELGELGRVEQRVRGARRQRYDPGPVPAQTPPTIAASASPLRTPTKATIGAGAGATGLPFRTSHPPGRDRPHGASTACTISAVAVWASDSMPRGTKPPTIAAATTAASATRHLAGMAEE